MPSADPCRNTLLRRARRDDLDARGRFLDHYRPYLTFLARADLDEVARVSIVPDDRTDALLLLAHLDLRDGRPDQARARLADYGQALPAHLKGTAFHPLHQQALLALDPPPTR